MDQQVLANQEILVYIRCVDTECYAEALPRAIANRDEWKDGKSQGVCAFSSTMIRD